MSPEHHPPSPEHETKPQRPVFDLEQFEVGDIVSLRAVLEDALDKKAKVRNLVFAFEDGMQRLAERNLEKTRDVVTSMLAHEDEWVRAEGAREFALLLRYAELQDYESQKKVVDAWLRFIDNPNAEGEARSAAYDAMGEATMSDWIDPVIARYLDDQMADRGIS